MFILTNVETLVELPNQSAYSNIVITSPKLNILCRINFEIEQHHSESNATRQENTGLC